MTEDTTMKQVYLKTTDGQYFVVRKISDVKLVLETTDIQNGVLTNPLTAPLVELHMEKTHLAIIFIKGSNKFLLKVRKESKQVYLELKEFTNRKVQKEDCYFKYENLGAVDYYSLSTVETLQMYISVSAEGMVVFTREITHAVHVKEEEA